MRLTRRRLLLASVVAVVVCGGWFTVPQRPASVTRIAFEKIRRGMPLEDVEHIVGFPGVKIPASGEPPLSIYSWSEDGFMIVVLLDDDQLVERKVYGDPPPSRLDMLLARFWAFW